MAQARVKRKSENRDERRGEILLVSPNYSPALSAALTVDCRRKWYGLTGLL